ncbi:MAG: hypothetical protein ACD_11C00004G0041 [uncultured bacterium]|nr:MAG: hypothetical protein ACD_11C00004G0041 [uncultured bacterium]HBR71939.1 tryptophan--tRNA ligase [Candidatus Moranbacteria bacterium]
MKKRIFSGVQPSGNLHIGNYLGAIKNWVELQDQYESIFCVVDLHAITVPQDPEELRKKTIEIAKIYLASGIDPKKSTIFIQSQVSEHAELAWILNTITRNSDLTKMTQFKDKTGIQFDFEDLEKALADLSEGESSAPEILTAINTPTTELEKIARQVAFKTAKEHLGKIIKQFNVSGVGLFDYPVLMAADILLYDTQTVPVGQDQIQHIELARTLARRFNKKYGQEIFKVPEYFVKEEGKMILALDDPSKKMSKSAASEYNYIALTDDAETVRRKIKKAVTDSGSEIIYADEKPALKNLINIYVSFSGKTPKEIEKMYEGKGYGEFKSDLAEVVVDFLKPFQEKFNALSDEEVLNVLREGGEKVREIAKKKMVEVKKKMGLIV